MNDVQEMQLVTKVLAAVNAKIAQPGFTLDALEATLLEAIKQEVPGGVPSEDMEHALAFAGVIGQALRTIRLILKAP